MSDKNTSQKFQRAAPKLVQNILRDLIKIQNLGKENFVTDDHKEQIIKTIKKELDTTKKVLNQDKGDIDFELK